MGQYDTLLVHRHDLHPHPVKWISEIDGKVEGRAVKVRVDGRLN